MRGVVYSHTGGPEVLRLVERPVREPGPGEVRVKIQVSGVNPTDWKARRGSRAGAELPFPSSSPTRTAPGRSRPSATASRRAESGSASGFGRRRGNARTARRRSWSSSRAVKRCDCQMQPRWMLERASESPL